MNIHEIYQDVLVELNKAVEKFPTWPTDPIHAYGVLAEESGELIQAILETTYEYPKSTQHDVYKEAVQVCAMAFRFLKSFEEYNFQKSIQHQQDSLYE